MLMMSLMLTLASPIVLDIVLDTQIVPGLSLLSSFALRCVCCLTRGWTAGGSRRAQGRAAASCRTSSTEESGKVAGSACSRRAAASQDHGGKQ